ncbi:hypothetical protein DE146DRAFT_632386 [Phaeosphaeria sp. MPI-PUGE-AT-0046c]|nr:hypothetical protein DE146DRAFT_632386 [Phaeosphaeria sp. MPI-PUGE-AT-0046c]
MSGVEEEKAQRVCVRSFRQPRGPGLRRLNALMLFIASFLVHPIAAWTDPKDKLINPRGQKVCMQQCGSSALKCPEAFKREQEGVCWRCCTTWGETVIRVECKESSGNRTRLAEIEKKKKAEEEAKEKERKKDGWEKEEQKDTDTGRELGFS